MVVVVVGLVSKAQDLAAEHVVMMVMVVVVL
jgi:hypothetical protein